MLSSISLHRASGNASKRARCGFCSLDLFCLPPRKTTTKTQSRMIHYNGNGNWKLRLLYNTGRRVHLLLFQLACHASTVYVRRDSALGRKRFLFVFNPLFFLTIGHYTERIREKKKRNEADGSDVTSFRRAVRTSQKTQGEADIPEEAEQGGKKDSRACAYW